MASSDYTPSVQTDKVATITSGTTVSAAIDLGGTQLCGLYMPAAFTGTTIKIQTAPSLAGTYTPVQSAGADYALTVGANKYVPVENLAILAGVRFIKLQSSASEAADRTITLASRPV